MWRYQVINEVMLMKNIILGILTLSIISGIFGPNPANAQSSRAPMAVSVSPPVSYLTVKPGENLNYQIQVKNLSNVPLEIRPELADFVPDEMSGRPVLREGSNFNQLTIDGQPPALTVPFTLQPNQAKNVQVVIDLPPSAPEAEYSLTILFAFSINQEFLVGNSSSVGQSAAIVEGKVGSNLILLSSRNNLDRGLIKPIKITSLALIDSFMPIEFTARAENSGKNATPAVGFASIYDWRNKEIARFEIHPDMILANSSRPLREKDFLSEEFRYKGPLHVGFYKIKIELQENTTEKAQINHITKTIVAIPIVILLLPLLGLTMYLIYKSIIKKSKSKLIKKLDAKE